MSIGAWGPLWLGETSRHLYGALHRAAALPGAPGVLMVPPLLHEQPRSRRFIAEVASGLAAKGLPALRFDFFGTGDSDGHGDQVDFASMHRDLDTAVAALRLHTGVERVVVFGWRAAALPLMAWSQIEQHADLLLLWEPVFDGQQWLLELHREDADQRRRRPRPRPGVRRVMDPDDGQLMGFAASPQLRLDLARAPTLADSAASRVPVWTAVRASAEPLPSQVGRTFSLPPDATTFTGGTDMESTFFLSPVLGRLVDELGEAMAGEMDRQPLERACR